MLSVANILRGISTAVAQIESGVASSFELTPGNLMLDTQRQPDEWEPDEEQILLGQAPKSVQRQLEGNASVLGYNLSPVNLVREEGQLRLVKAHRRSATRRVGTFGAVG